MNNTSSLAEDMQPTPVIEPKLLETYFEQVAQIKGLTTEKDLNNKIIKGQLGQFVLDNLKAALKPHGDLVDRYLAIVADQSAEAVVEASEEEKAETEKALRLVRAELGLAGITEEMILDLISGDRLKALSHNKVALEISGYSVNTVIQDRSQMNQERAAAYLMSKGFDKLLTTKVVINEAALETAIYNGEVDPAEFKRFCIDENFVVNLRVTK